MSGFELLVPWRRGRERSRFAFSLLSLLVVALFATCSPSAGLPQTVDAPPELVSPPARVPVDDSSAGAQLDSQSGVPPVDGVVGLQAATTLPSIAGLVDVVKPAVVSISVESLTTGMFFEFGNQGAGSGIVVRPDGYVVTNTHVIQNARKIKVNLPSGQTYEARVVGQDVLTDLAVLKVEAENLPTARFGDSDSLRVGDWVVALGNALALKGGPTVTLGIISARGRTVNTERAPLYDMIQTDAAINDGNSGGPLVNLRGEVIGINTAIVRQAQGIGFAVSSVVASPIIDSLVEHGRVVRPLIGLTGGDVTPARANELNLNVTEGIIVMRISPEGPAYEAGIRSQDVIVSVDGIPTPDMARFLTLLWTYDVGDEVEVEYIRDNKTSVTSIILVQRPPD